MDALNLGVRRALTLIILSLFSILPSLAQDLPQEVQKDMNRLKRQESVYWRKSDWEKHMRVCHEFLSNYEKYLSDKDRGIWNTKIAGTFIELGSYILAVEYLEKGIRFADKDLASYAHSQLGLSYLKLERFDDAIKQYKLAAKTATNRTAKVSNYNSIGFVYFKKKDYKNARKWYNKALELYRMGGVELVQEKIIKSNLGSLYIETGDPDKGLLYLEQLALPEYEKREIWFAIEVYSKLAKFHIASKNCDEANKALNRLGKFFDAEASSNDYLRYLELRLKHANTCDMSQKVGDYILEYLQVNKAISARNHEQLLIIEKLQREELKRRLKLVSDNLKLKKESETQYKRLMWVSGVLLIVVLIALLVWWRGAKIRQKRKENFLKLREKLIEETAVSNQLKQEMEEKELRNKKLELMQLLQSTNNNATLLEELQSRLNELNKKEGDVHDDITQLLHFLKSHSLTQAMNEVIENNIDVIGGDFKDRFFKVHDNLTSSETQLALLIRIGMGTKEMAMMRNVEPTSIRIFKHRLKTKLQLDKEVDLSEYIQTF